jgi:hypothetical protein
VVNFMNDDPKFDHYLRRLKRDFGGAVLALPALYDPNILAFAFRGAPPSIAWSTLRSRAESSKRAMACRSPGMFRGCAP